MPESLRTASALLLVALASSIATTRAVASPGVALDQFRPAPRGDDGFVVSRPDVPNHLQPEARVSFDYARNPLVYELQQGVGDGKKVALVSDQLRMNLAASLGLFDRLLVFAVLPVDLMLAGSAYGSQPTATGAGAGDLALGARGVFYRPGSSGALALQLTGTLPSAAGGALGPAVAGDSGATLHPQLLGELGFSRLRVTVNAGLRMRRQLTLPSAHFGNELTYALALTLHLLEHKLDANAELFGVTPAADVGRRVSSPLELALGLMLRAGACRFGLASGFGLVGGYGSPELRIAALAAYRFADHEREAAAPATAAAAALRPAAPAPTPPPPAAQPQAPVAVAQVDDDADHDGLKDAQDQCPAWPGPTSTQGCPQSFSVQAETGALVLQTPLRWRHESAVLDENSAGSLAELAAALVTNHARILVLAHVAPRGNPVQSVKITDQRALALVRWLLARGVDSEQVEAYGCAGNRPIAPARTKNRWKNERVELFATRPLPKLGMPGSVGCEAVTVAAAPAAVAPQSAPPAASVPVRSAPAAAAPAAPPAPAATAPRAPALPPPPPPTAAVSSERIAPAEPPHSRTIGGSKPRVRARPNPDEGAENE